jgi:hypothetical protein
VVLLHQPCRQVVVEEAVSRWAIERAGLVPRDGGGALVCTLSLLAAVYAGGAGVA